MIPERPVSEEMYVLSAVEKFPPPKVTVIVEEFKAVPGPRSLVSALAEVSLVALGVSDRLVEETGGITPPSPVALRVEVAPELENWAAPEETTKEILSGVLEVVLEGAVVLSDVGGITPPSPVDIAVEVAPAVLKLPAPAVLVASTIVSGTDVGGLAPPPPVDV